MRAWTLSNMEMMMLGTLADSTRAATAMIGDFGTSRWQFYFKAINFPRRRKGPHQRIAAMQESAVGPKRTSRERASMSALGPDCVAKLDEEQRTTCSA